MTLDELERAIKAGATDEEIMAANEISETALRTMKGRLKTERKSEEEKRTNRLAYQKRYREERRAAARNGAEQLQPAPKLTLEREVLAITDSNGTYWAGFFDALGTLDFKTGPDGLSATARFSFRKEAQIDRFIGRYGGDKRGGENGQGSTSGMYAVILTEEDDGINRLINDLASESRLFKERATALLEWLDLKQRTRAKEQELREKFKA